MPRGLKQFLYGIFYLAIIVGLGFGAYVKFWRVVPSCFDGVQNQGEQGIDCGGLCAQVCAPVFSPIGFSSSSIFWNSSGRATFVAQATNPNVNGGAFDFKYVFSLRDASGTTVGSVPGDSFLYPGQTKYVVAVNQAVATSVVSADCAVVGDVPWVPSSTIGNAPVLNLQNVATAQVASGTLATSGVVVNQDPVAVSDVLLVAFFKNSSGETVGISQTQINQIPAGGSANFSVLYPLNSNIDSTKTEVDAYGVRM
jgi:hypothetical protein